MPTNKAQLTREQIRREQLAEKARDKNYRWDKDWLNGFISTDELIIIFDS